MKRRYIFLLVISLTVVTLDQWTKALVRQALPFGMEWLPFPALPFIRIVHWYNRGAAFGLFQNGGLVFTVLAIFVSLAILYYYPRLGDGHWLLRFALGLQLGGALGNLIDRLHSGMVTDFIAIGKFPVFNLADSSITIGTALLFLSSWIYEHQHKRSSTDDAYGTSGDATVQ